VLSAIDKNETVVITYRGQPRAVLKPIRQAENRPDDLAAHPFFGMNPPTEGDTSLNDLRGGRFRAI